MRTRLGLLFGGQSAEHEVSVVSARAVHAAADRDKYDLLLVRIERSGTWTLLSDAASGSWPGGAVGRPVFPAPQRDGGVTLLAAAPQGEVLARLDVVFPVLHGPNGEDGTVQGLLQANGVAYVGAGVLGSAIGMDKDVMKRLLLQAGLPTARARVLQEHEITADTYDRCVEALGSPLFVKPVNTGSSVGISKVVHREGFEAALTCAFAYDHKVIVEEFVDGREIECGVLGTRDPRVSVAGEIVTTHDFYSYQAKYQDQAATSLVIPASISQQAELKMKSLAVRAYRALCCAGMARVDFFMDAAERFWINEINTIPGFTRHSMFPLLWAQSGLSFSRLVDCLVDDALERHQQTAALKRIR